MSLAEAFKAYQPQQLGLECMTCALVRTMPDHDVAAFEAALANKKPSNPAILQILKENGYDHSFGPGTLGRHRRNECTLRRAKREAATE